MPGSYSTPSTYTLPGRAFGMDNVTSRVQVIQFNLRICTGITWVLPLSALVNSDQDGPE